MSSLQPCPSCARHVFVKEVACPFCAAPLAAAAQSARLPFVGGLSRAQRASLAVAAVSAQLLIGCEEETKAIAIYGAPWPPDGSVPGDGDGDGDGDDDAATPEG